MWRTSRKWEFNSIQGRESITYLSNVLSTLNGKLLRENQLACEIANIVVQTMVSVQCNAQHCRPKFRSVFIARAPQFSELSHATILNQLRDARRSLP